jgi:hypothetical protein
MDGLSMMKRAVGMGKDINVLKGRTRVRRREWKIIGMDTIADKNIREFLKLWSAPVRMRFGEKACKKLCQTLKEC